MKKATAVLLVILILLSPLAAKTGKTDPDKIYIGLHAGYNGVRDSFMMMLVDLIGTLFGGIMTGGQAVPDVDPLFQHGLALGGDSYFELSPSLALSLAGGCTLDFNPEGRVDPAPYGDAILYMRFNGGPKGDFLYGLGVGTYAVLKPEGMEGHLGLLTSMRYQLDVLPNMAWWVDAYIGWNAFRYGSSSFRFVSDRFSVMHGIRTGCSYAF